MFTALAFVIVAVLSFAAGRATARPKTPKRDKRGRFIKAKPPRRFVMPTVRLPDFGPQHLAVLAAALAGVLLASMAPAVLAPVAFLLPLPLGVAIGRKVITPTRSKMSWHDLPLTVTDPSSAMWEDWAC